MQKQVYTESALGLAGTISRLNPTPQHLPFLAEGSAVKAGGFVFAGTDAEKQVKGLGGSGVAPVGLCIFENMQPSLGAANGLSVLEGEEVMVLLKGCAYITAPSAVTKGQHIAVNPTTGAIEAFNAVEATGAVTGSLTSGAITGTADDGVVTGSVTNTAVTGTAAIAATGASVGFVDTGFVVLTGAASGYPCEIMKM